MKLQDELKGLSSDDLALILKDQKDMYSSEELEEINEMLIQQKSKEDEYCKSLLPEEIVCHKCDGINSFSADVCKYCGVKLKKDDYYIQDEEEPIQECIPKCLTCGSTDLTRISIAHKVGKIALFGVFGMGDNGKTWKCNNCGVKW